MKLYRCAAVPLSLCFGQKTKGKVDLAEPAVLTWWLPGSKTEVTEVLQIITSEISGFHEVRELSPCSVIPYQIKEGFLSTSIILLKLIIVGKMVIVAVSSGSFWEVKLRFSCLFTEICPSAFFPKTLYIQASPISLLPFFSHTISNRNHNKTAFLRPCHDVIRMAVQRLMYLFYSFTKYFFSSSLHFAFKKKKISLFIPSFSFCIPSMTSAGVPTDDADLKVTWKTTFSILNSVDSFCFPAFNFHCAK